MISKKKPKNIKIWKTQQSPSDTRLEPGDARLEPGDNFLPRTTARHQPITN